MGYDRPMQCCSPGDSPFDRHFDARHAARHLRDYRTRGPQGLTRQLVDALAAGGLADRTVLDVGGGVGVVHHELLRAGAASAVEVDASSASVSAARAEAGRQGHGDRASYVVGDFVALADGIEPADVVALDRVICCYPEMPSLVARSAALARWRYGLVYPRDSLLARAVVALENLRFRVTRSAFRVHIHRTADVEALVREAGLVKQLHRRTLGWQLVVFERPSA